MNRVTTEASQARQGGVNWIIKLPFIFFVYHLFALLAVFTMGQRLLFFLELPVLPFVAFLAHLADKRIIVVSNAAVMPILLFATSVIWILYGVGLGYLIDHRAKETFEPTGLHFKVVVGAVLFLIAIALLQ